PDLEVAERRVRANTERIQERAVMGNLLPERVGLRYHGWDSVPGAQTERPDAVGPVRGLLGGTTSPAAFLWGTLASCPGQDGHATAHEGERSIDIQAPREAGQLCKDLVAPGRQVYVPGATGTGFQHP